MFCPNCGTQLPDDANFCLKCGKPQSDGVSAADEAKWEYCQVETMPEMRGCGNFTSWRYGLRADAWGPTGEHTVRESPKWEDGDVRASESIRTEFVQGLIQDGWEPTPERGEHGQLRLRRRVK